MKSSTDRRLTGLDVLNKHSTCEPIFYRLEISCSTTDGSAKVEVSPS